MLKNLVLLLCLLALRTANAADLTVLAQSADWHRLVHYERDWLLPTALTSAIHSDEFFLSEAGMTDPRAELQATLEAMLAPVTMSNDSHAKCRFPARLIWLRKVFPQLQEQLAPIACPEFTEKSGIDRIGSISVVFANGYLGNPASYYGHLFLKMNPKDSSAAGLVDMTLNYGAIDTGHDNPVSYLVKGIFGGYDGGFSPVEFYFHQASYGELELRDLWEYRLNLHEQDVRYLVSHAWELMQKNYTYYFFHDNCAFRVAELLEVIDGVKANPRYRPWIFPQAVVQQISNATYLSRPLVASKVYHPSRQTRLYQRYTALNATQRMVVTGIAEKKMRLDGLEMADLQIDQKYGVIDTLLDYYQFLHNNDKQNGTGKLPADYVDTLAVRLRLPSGGAGVPMEQAGSPDTGHAASYVQVGMAHVSHGPNSKTFRLRPAYYDPLDAGAAQARNSGLSMGDTLLEVVDGRVRIRQFDLIALDTVNPAVTGLPGDRGTGWRMKAGLEQERVACNDCLAARLQGEYTIGTLLGSPHVFGALSAGGALQAYARIDGPGFARIGASVVVRPSQIFGLRGGVEVRRPFNANARPYAVTSAEVRLELSRDYDARIRWDHDFSSRISVGVGRYW